MIDPTSGLHIPQPLMPIGSRVGVPRPIAKGYGTITYRCHTCGELIVKPWDVLFVDDTPGREHASNITPGRMTARTTTHHDWHMASEQ